MSATEHGDDRDAIIKRLLAEARKDDNPVMTLACALFVAETERNRALDQLRGAVDALRAIVARTEDEEEVYDYGRGAVEAVAAMRQIAVDALQELEDR